MVHRRMFGGKPPSFGFYGGHGVGKIKFNPRTVRGQFQTVCIACPKKAIYHCGGDGYCRDHKALAVKRLEKRGGYYGERNRAYEEAQKEFDAAMAARDRLRHLRRNHK